MKQNTLCRALGVGMAALALGAGAVPAAAQMRVRMSQDTLVRAELGDRISSRDARVGDRVMARVDDRDRSDFPPGTRFDGRVTEVIRARRGQPATIDMAFDRATLPNGRDLAIRGELASLADDDVRTTADGRLESRRRSGRDSFEWKWVGYGAGGGAVLGQVFGGAPLKGGIIGALGGAIYSYLNKDEDRDYRDLTLTPGTEFGIRLAQPVEFSSRPEWRGGRYRQNVLGSRSEYRFGPDTRVLFDGRQISFGEDRPVLLDGIEYVPLRPIADAAGWRYFHDSGETSFTLRTDRGDLRAYERDRFFTRGGARIDLADPAILRGGEIYVPVSFLSQAGDLRVEHNGDRLELSLR